MTKSQYVMAAPLFYRYKRLYCILSHASQCMVCHCNTCSVLYTHKRGHDDILSAGVPPVYFIPGRDEPLGSLGRFPFHSPPIGLGTPTAISWGTAGSVRCPRLPLLLPLAARLLSALRFSEALRRSGSLGGHLFGRGATSGTGSPRSLVDLEDAAVGRGALFGVGSSPRRCSAPGFRSFTFAVERWLDTARQVRLKGVHVTLRVVTAAHLSSAAVRASGP